MALDNRNSGIPGWTDIAATPMAGEGGGIYGVAGGGGFGNGFEQYGMPVPDPGSSTGWSFCLPASQGGGFIPAPAPVQTAFGLGWVGSSGEFYSASSAPPAVGFWKRMFG